MWPPSRKQILLLLCSRSLCVKQTASARGGKNLCLWLAPATWWWCRVLQAPTKDADPSGAPHLLTQHHCHCHQHCTWFLICTKH